MEKQMLKLRLVPRLMPAAFLATALAGGLAPGIASAALGEPEATVQSDAERAIAGQIVPASVKSTEHGLYREHEITLPSGTAVREFVGADGNVFAVAWRGPTLPDLRRFLGRYFVDYAAGAAANRAGRNHLEIRGAAFVAQSGGHMRAFVGRAYLPQAVPSGLSLGDVR